jgi:hypothetical protein
MTTEQDNHIHKSEALRCLKEAMEKLEIVMSDVRPELRDVGLGLAKQKAKEIEELIKKI